MTASFGAKEAGGRLDPSSCQTLFTADTKEAVENCKQKAVHLADPLPLKDMYDEIPPHVNSSHGLTEYLSRRGESKLEAFHDRLSNFANSGMRATLADNLHLAGTARYNLAIRHKRSLIKNPQQERSSTPAAWEKVVPFFNHAELCYINRMAEDVGCSAPFPNAEELPADNGERFFSEYITIVRPAKQQYDEDDACLCQQCNDDNKPPAAREAPPIKQNDPRQMDLELTRTTVAATVNNPQQTVSKPAQRAAPRAAPAPPQPIPFCWMPLLPPMIPGYYTPQPCCNKYMQWTQRRLGRPPHERHCYRRRVVVNSSDGSGAVVQVLNGNSIARAGTEEKKGDRDSFYI